MIVVETRICGACSDGLDNDGDGNTDAQDADCTKLADQLHFGLIGRSPRGKSVFIGGNTVVRVAPGSDDGSIFPFPVGPSLASVCGERQQMTAGVQISGYLAGADEQSLKFGSDTNVGRGLLIGPATKVKSPLKLNTTYIGPGSCDGLGVRSCDVTADCLDPATCVGATVIDPANPFIDRTTAHAEYSRCSRAKASLGSAEAYFHSLAITNPAYDLGLVRVVYEGTLDLPTLRGPGPHVLSIYKLLVGGKATLRVTADDPNAVVIIKVERAMKVGKGAQILVGGSLLPQNVLWSVHGRGSVGISGLGTVFHGNVLAPDRKVKVGQNVHVLGSLMANSLKITGLTTIDHLPFVF